MMKDIAHKFTGRKPKSMGEEGRKHHNLIGIGCGDVFPFHRCPLEHLTVGKKLIGDQFEDLILICGGCLEHLEMGGGHGVEEHGVHEKGAEMAAELRNGLGIDLSPVFIAGAMKGVLNSLLYFCQNFGVR
jgi:hypothetical protein